MLFSTVEPLFSVHPQFQDSESSADTYKYQGVTEEVVYYQGQQEIVAKIKLARMVFGGIPL